MGYQWPQDFDRTMRNFFEPQSIAIIGATEGPGYGSRMIDNLIQCGFAGRIYPVNPKRSEVRGLPCFKSVSDIEGRVDLAAVVIPAAAVLAAVEECARKGIRAIVIISAGFLERDGQTGAQRQSELQRFAAENGIYICGPNCLGIGNLENNAHVNSTPELGKLLPKSGPIGVVSQSGATAFGPILLKAMDRAVGLKYIVSTGNEAGLEAADFMRFMLEDPEIRVLIAFIEGFKNGDKLKAVADLALEKQKPVIVMKMGRSQTGGQAALTHTASIAGSFAVHDGFFRQKGFIRVDDYDELCEVADIFAKGKYPDGDRVGLISHSGGICTFLADECDLAGLEVPCLSSESCTRIGQILQGWGSCQNPLDLTGTVRGPHFPVILQQVMQDANVDSTILATRGDRNFAETVIGANQAGAKPLLFVWTHSEFDSDGLTTLRNSDVPTFISPVKCVKALKHLRTYRRKIEDASRAKTAKNTWRNDLQGLNGPIEEVKAALRGHPEGAIPEGQSRAMLSPLGLPFCPSEVCRSVDDACDCAVRIGYPVALKVASPQIIHKTEYDGVVLNICGEAELRVAYAQLAKCGQSFAPGVSLDGILVQKMITGGIELLLGVSRDPIFGPTLMLGWGGIHVEAMGLSTIRVCPVTPDDALDMIAEIPGLAKILKETRGRASLDQRALVDTMVRVGHIAHSVRDEVAAIDFNPLSVLTEGAGVRLLDCRIVVSAGSG